MTDLQLWKMNCGGNRLPVTEFRSLEVAQRRIMVIAAEETTPHVQTEQDSSAADRQRWAKIST